MSAELRGDEHLVRGADSTTFATLRRGAETVDGVTFVLSAASGRRGDLGAFIVGERELSRMPNAPRVNFMSAAIRALDEPAWLLPAGAVGTRLCTPAGALARAAHGVDADFDGDVTVLRSRAPTWDSDRALLTLDFPPGRATRASVRNFQLVVAGAAGGGGTDAGFALVHG